MLRPPVYYMYPKILKTSFQENSNSSFQAELLLKSVLANSKGDSDIVKAIENVQEVYVMSISY